MHARHHGSGAEAHRHHHAYGRGPMTGFPRLLALVGGLAAVRAMSRHHAAAHHGVAPDGRSPDWSCHDGWRHGTGAPDDDVAV